MPTRNQVASSHGLGTVLPARAMALRFCGTVLFTDLFPRQASLLHRRRLLMGRRRLAHTNVHRKASNKCYSLFAG